MEETPTMEIQWDRRCMLFEKERIYEAVSLSVNQMSKTELNWKAKLLNKSPIIPNFEQISFPINIDDLTTSQLRRFILKTYKTYNKEALYILLSKTSKNLNFENCIVCMSIMGHQKNSLDCGHWIHYSCMRKLNVNRGKCPVCKKKVYVPKSKRKRLRLVNYDSDTDDNI